MKSSRIHRHKETILSKQASCIESLSQSNQYLRDQLEFLREKLREKDEKIEICNLLLTEMEELVSNKTSLYKIHLN